MKLDELRAQLRSGGLNEPPPQPIKAHTNPAPATLGTLTWVDIVIVAEDAVVSIYPKDGDRVMDMDGSHVHMSASPERLRLQIRPHKVKEIANAHRNACMNGQVRLNIRTTTDEIILAVLTNIRFELERPDLEESERTPWAEAEATVLERRMVDMSCTCVPARPSLPHASHRMACPVWNSHKKLDK